jgi:hypothetical protein
VDRPRLEFLTIATPAPRSMIAAAPIGVPLLHRGDFASPVSFARTNSTLPLHAAHLVRSCVSRTCASSVAIIRERIVLLFGGGSPIYTSVRHADDLRASSRGSTSALRDSSPAPAVVCSLGAASFGWNPRRSARSSYAMPVDTRIFSSLRESMIVAYRTRRCSMMPYVRYSARRDISTCSNSKLRELAQ